MIRFAEREDIASIVDLHLRIFGSPTTSPPPPADLDYETILFDHPWFDPEVRSIVWDKDGEVLGLLGVMARPMQFGDRRIRAAIPTRFMVDARSGGALVAIRLLKALAAMPIDLAVNDNSNDATRDVWLRAGAAVFVASSLRWTRPFQPLENMRRRLGQRLDAAGLAARWAKPASWACDALLHRRGWNEFSDRGGLQVDATLDPSRLLPSIRAECSRRALRPVYDDASFGWQLAQLERMGRYRQLHGAVVQDPTGRDVGWYLYYQEPGGKAHLLQLGATPRREEAVFATLLAEVYGRGAVALTGRADLRFLGALANERCGMVPGSPWSLILTADKALASALQGEDAFFSRLEGEWW